jgi:segregation and condensation protein B
MEIWELKSNIEGILIAVNHPVTLQVLAQALDASEQEIEEALQEYEADLSAADRGVQVRHRARGVRLEVKPQIADRLHRVVPAWAAKPITGQSYETLAIIALKQPVTIGEINGIRGIESAGTVQTLSNRKLIARAARRGPRREKYWKTTPLFLETFGLSSLDELYQDGRMEEVFPAVYSGEVSDDEDDEPNEREAFTSSESAVDDDDLSKSQ